MTVEYKAKALPKAMIKLYGEKEAELVRERCYETDNFFGDWVTQYIYGILWELPPLSFLDKSLVTIVSLMVLEKEEQLQIHLKGIFNLGQNIDFILSILLHLKENDYLLTLDKVLLILNQAILSYNVFENVDTIKMTSLSPRELDLISLSALVAEGNMVRLNVFLNDVLSKETLSIEEIKGIFRHQMTYCGCPCTMNAFAVLNAILAESYAT